MPTYVVLANFTEQGLRNIKDTPKRAEAFKALAKQHDCTVKEILWTHGHYDIVSIIDAADEASATSLGLSVAKLGNVRTHTCAHSRQQRWPRSWTRSLRLWRNRK